MHWIFLNNTTFLYMKKTPIVNVKDLRVFFPQQDLPIKAVDGLSYEINQGETQAIFSESGSEKSISAMILIPGNDISNGYMPSIDYSGGIHWVSK